MEELKKKLEPILKEHIALDHKCAEDSYYDYDAFERNKIWKKEGEALKNSSFEDVVGYLNAVDSAEKLEALSEEFYEEVSYNLFGDKRREVLDCFRRNSRRLSANLDEFLDATEEELKKATNNSK
jgi:hypothetical protein